MLQSFANAPGAVRPALVSRLIDDAPRYLQLAGQGDAMWVKDPAAATPFPSMRDAARMALRLPATARAFGLPLEPELSAYDEAARLH